MDHGPAGGWPVVLLPGFSYDIHAFDEVWPLLTQQGARVIVPSIRGFFAVGTRHAAQTAA